LQNALCIDEDDASTGSDDGTRLKVDIEITGPLSRFWGFMAGRKHAAGLPAQTARILAQTVALV
jgi:hypothetical protein